MRMRDPSTLSLIAFHLLLATGLGLTTERPLGAQDPSQEASAPEPAMTERCTGPEFLEFDFWLGRWEVLDRITWQSLDDGRVRHVWEVSPDGGESWNELFRGLYEKTAGGEANSAVQRRTPGELEWREAPSGASFANLYGNPAEAGPFAFRMRMPPAFEMQPHSHDTAEHLTVLSGTLHMRFSRNGEVVSLPAGSVISIPADRPMWGWTEDRETVLQVQGVGPFRTTPLTEGEASPAAGASWLGGGYDGTHP